MDRLLLPLIGLLAWALAAGGGVWWWDRHPPLHWRGPIPLLGPTLSLPDSLVTQRDRARALAAAAEGDRRQCRANAQALTEAIGAQNAAVARLRTDSEARLARSAKAAQAARAVAQSQRVRVEAILAARPAGADLCRAAAALIEQEATR